MTAYFVTRHPGAREWAEGEGIRVDYVVDHLDVGQVRPGDVVIGSLPVNLAAQVCSRGGRYLHLCLELPRDIRGRELSAEEMRQLGAWLEEVLQIAYEASALRPRTDEWGRPLDPDPDPEKPKPKG